MTSAIACSRLSAASCSSRCRSISIPESICAIGLTLFWPVYLGADPCVALKPATPRPHAGHPGRQSGDPAAVAVRGEEGVVLLRPLDELHVHVVHDPVVELDVVVLGRDLARDAQPEAVRALHDVRFFDGRALFTAVPGRVAG